MDVKYITACGFLGVYRTDKRLRAYQFGYLDDAQVEKVSLPCPQAFTIMEKDNWIITKDQVSEIMASLYPDFEEEEEGEQ